MSDYAYENLETPENVESGVAEYALLAPKSWFTSDGIKTPTAPFSAAGDEVTIKDAHVFKAGKAFVKYQLAPQKNSYGAKAAGDVGLKRQNSEATIFVPGSYAAAFEAVKNLLNTPLVVLIPDSNCGLNLFYQLGCNCLFAWIDPDFTTGTTKDGVKGHMIKITYDDGPLLYKVSGGPAVLEDAGSSS